MKRMRFRRQRPDTLLPVFFLLILPAAALPAQLVAPGDIEFFARIQPAGGRPEPVRGVPFYLLRKSVSDIRKQAAESAAPLDLQAFVDTLPVSPELKSWMKKNNSVALSGSDFTKKLTADDVTGIPEFLDAYMAQNGASLGAGVPAPKFKDSDRDKNPQKYRRERGQYLQSLQRYIHAHPETLLGLDAQLRDSNPSQSWARLQAEQQQKIERLAQRLAQTTYLCAQADSGLDGRAVLHAIPPGDYWLATLDTPAIAGDVRLHWDLPVHVASGQTLYVELSNLNAIESPSRSQ